jgi:chromosome segregation ATPase
MRKIVFTLTLLASSALGQTSAKEQDKLQALLSEVRQLRQNIELMTVASQRIQIALYSLQMQDAAVARTTQPLDGARNKCLELGQNRKQMEGVILRMESALASGDRLDGEAATFKSRLPAIKNGLEVQAAEVQACQATEAEVSSQLRNDQAKLAELQDRIERMGKTIENPSAIKK